MLGGARVSHGLMVGLCNPRPTALQQPRGRAWSPGFAKGLQEANTPTPAWGHQTWITESQNGGGRKGLLEIS